MRSIHGGRLAVLVTAWLVVAGCGDDGASTSTTASTAPSGPGTVTLSLEGLTGASGNALAGLLFPGDGTTAAGAVGVVATLIDADPFTAALTFKTAPSELAADGPSGACFAGELAAAAPSDCALFPYPGDADAVVEPGTYTARLYIDTVLMGPYSRWVPGLAGTMYSCAVTFEVRGPTTTLVVTDIPRSDPAPFETTSACVT